MFHNLTELIEKIRLGEDSRIEFKRELPCDRNRLADEIAAFANARGGIILIGVDDAGTIVGIPCQDLNKVERTVVEICTDTIVPMVPIDTEKLQINATCLLKIEVPDSPFIHKSPKGYYLRQGSSKTRMPRQDLATLVQSRLLGHIFAFDRQPLPMSNKGTLRKTLYQRFIAPGITHDDDVEDVLLKSGLLVQSYDERCASVAGVLMCHDNPRRYLNNSFIQAVYYNDVQKDVNYEIDAKDFGGPLDQQIVGAFQFVEKHNYVSNRRFISKINQPRYSMRAIFEAIVNTVVHRDYSKIGSKIRLFMFADRLELYSPGGLAQTLRVEDLPYNQATRNELLARLLSEVTLDDDIGTQVVRRHFLECRGEGVGIILDESEKLGAKTPLYNLYGEELCLTIFAATSLQDNHET